MPTRRLAAPGLKVALRRYPAPRDLGSEPAGLRRVLDIPAQAAEIRRMRAGDQKAILLYPRSIQQSSCAKKQIPIGNFAQAYNEGKQGVFGGSGPN